MASRRTGPTVKRPSVSLYSAFRPYWQRVATKVACGYAFTSDDAADLLQAADVAEEAGDLYHAWLLRSRVDAFSQGLLKEGSQGAVFGLQWTCGLALADEPRPLLLPLSAPQDGDEVPLDLVALLRRAVATVTYAYDKGVWRPRLIEEFQPW